MKVVNERVYEEDCGCQHVTVTVCCREHQGNAPPNTMSQLVAMMDNIPFGTEYTANRYDDDNYMKLHLYTKEGQSYDIAIPKTAAPSLSETKGEGSVAKCPKCGSLNIKKSNDPLFDWQCNHCGQYWYNDTKETEPRRQHEVVGDG